MKAYESTNVKIIIPQGVKKIRDYQFLNRTDIKEIVIPDSVTRIGESAFEGCTGLTKITIPEGVKEIGDLAFCGCTGLKIVDVFAMECWGWNVFGDCSGITEVVFHKTVTRIDDSFSGCTVLKEVKVQSGVKVIGENAFEDCTGLRIISIPSSIEEIGEAAFSGCSELEQITIPRKVKIITQSAFEGCTGLKEITLPSSITEIDDHAFSDCTSLKEFTIPKGIKVIGDYVFSGSGLKKVDIYGWGEYEGYDLGVFSSCNGIEEVIIHDGVTCIHNAFIECNNLTKVTIPNSVTEIGCNAFSGCSGLTQITIPDSVTKIGDYAFSGCSGLTQIIIPDSVTEIGVFAFYGCSGLTEIAISNNITKIAPGTFEGCTGLNYVAIPGNVTEIGEYHPKYWASGAFSNCSGLTKVTIPDSVIIIGNNTFCGCTKLLQAIIPAGVKIIGDSAFKSCKELTEIKIPDNIKKLGENTFKKCTNLKKAFIPQKLVEQINDYFDDGIRLNYEVLDGTAVLPYGINSTKYFDFQGRNDINDVIIPDTVTEISPGTFKGCTWLKRIIINDSIEAIGDSAFESCTGLTEVFIPDSVLSIGSKAFFGCSELSELVFEEYTPSNSIERIYFPHRIDIGGAAFKECSSLKKATIPATLKDQNLMNFFDNGVKFHDASRRTALEAINMKIAVREFRESSGIDLLDSKAYKAALFNPGCEDNYWKWAKENNRGNDDSDLEDYHYWLVDEKKVNLVISKIFDILGNDTVVGIGKYFSIEEAYVGMEWWKINEYYRPAMITYDEKYGPFVTASLQYIDYGEEGEEYNYYMSLPQEQVFSLYGEMTLYDQYMAALLLRDYLEREMYCAEDD